jgi:hypothetical protein
MVNLKWCVKRLPDLYVNLFANSLSSKFILAVVYVNILTKNFMIVVIATQKIQDSGVASRMKGVTNFTPSSCFSCKCHKNIHFGFVKTKYIFYLRNRS